MRDFGKVAPQFWTGKTGKGLRGCPEAQVVALYLMTSPHATMIGVYSLPMLYLMHETGLTEEGACKGLARCIEGGFCDYDEDTETVFVVNMAAHQIGDVLKPGDKRGGMVRSQFRAIGSQSIKASFFARYGVAFTLDWPAAASPSEGASEGAFMPLSLSPSPSLSQEKQEQGGDVAAPVLAAYHTILPACLHISVLNDKRRKRIRAAVALAKRVCRDQGWPYEPEEFWAAYFAECAKDEWLRGDKPNPKSAKWKQNLDTLLAEDRFAEIMDRALAGMAGES